MNWDELNKLRQDPSSVPPPGSITSADYAARYGYGSSKAKADLAKLTANGKLKKTMVKVKNAWVPHYSAVESPQETSHEPAGRRKHRGRPNRG